MLIPELIVIITFFVGVSFIVYGIYDVIKNFKRGI